uniref:Uncharacterized protein n=1 Tax=Rhizophora mucronata TaxID=61149 RepID=A0A2P2NNK3_RHIMU
MSNQEDQSLVPMSKPKGQKSEIFQRVCMLYTYIYKDKIHRKITCQYKFTIGQAMGLMLVLVYRMQNTNSTFY